MRTSRQYSVTKLGQALLIGLAFALVGSLLARGEDTNSFLEGQWTGAAYLSYAPEKPKSYGFGVAALKPLVDWNQLHLGSQIGLQYWDNGQLGKVWLPNGMLNLSYDIHIKKVVVKPLVEFGGALDTHCHPYSIVGAGGAIGYQFTPKTSLDGFAGVEQWTGPYDKATLYKFGLALNWRF